MDDLFDISDHLKKYAERYKNDLEKSLTFLSWLNQCPPQVGSPQLYGKRLFTELFTVTTTLLQSFFIKDDSQAQQLFSVKYIRKNNVLPRSKT